MFFTINSHLFQELEENKSFESNPYGNYLKYYESIKDTTAYGKQMKANALSFLGDLDSRNRLIAQVFNYQNRKPFEISEDFQPWLSILAKQCFGEDFRTNCYGKQGWQNLDCCRWIF